jgi:protein-tyrosine-phosphatase
MTKFRGYLFSTASQPQRLQTGQTTPAEKTVLFVCLHNAGRSQMSAALFNQAAKGRHTALSAGTTPADQVYPEVIKVMHELNIDLTHKRPQLLTQELASQADIIVTMGCGDQCPYIPGKRYIDWALPDPKNKTIPEVREIRKKITKCVDRLIRELNS